VAGACFSVGLRSSVCAPLSLSPSRLSPPSTHGRVDGAAAELLLPAVAGVEGGQAPRRCAWVGPWRPPSSHSHGGLLQPVVMRWFGVKELHKVYKLQKYKLHPLYSNLSGRCKLVQKLVKCSI
jgi:hypothetical protein